MGPMHWAERDLGSDINGVKNTFSSWDSCMSKAYCKWPVIIGIIIGALIVISLLSCLFRCLCCGVECCCGCLSCCNACCPSPRRRQGYQQQPPPPPTPYQQYPMYNQYQPPQQPPVYSSGGLGYRSMPQTATFDMPSRNQGGATASSADTLPHMPTWETARTHHVEEEDEIEDVEMEKLVPRPSPGPTSPPTAWQHQQQQQQQQLESRSLYPQHTHSPIADARNPYTFPTTAASHPNPYDDAYAAPPQPPTAYDVLGANRARHPGSPGGHGHSSPAASFRPQITATSPQSPSSGPYAPSYPPSYTSAPFPSATPSAPRPPSGLQIGRRPVQGSWREV